MRIITRYLRKRVASLGPARLVTIALLAVLGGSTVWGLVALWPDPAQVSKIAERTPLLAAGSSFERGEVIDVETGCDAETACLRLAVGLHTGPDAGRMVTVEVRGALAQSGLASGDDVEVMSLPAPPQPNADDEADTDARYELARDYSLAGVFRGLPLALLALVFAGVVVAVGRLRGLLALGALAISAAVLVLFLLPALVIGSPGLLTGVVAACAIMFVILYVVHGPNLRTTSALIGTLCGIAIMAAVSLIAMQTTRLSGIGDEAAGTLAGITSQIDFRGLLSCSIIIAGLGILNDVTITQASAVWELRAAAPGMPRSEVYAAAMRIGRDHIASTVYTVFFAYVGAALSVLILLYLYDRPLLSLLTHEDIAIEIVRTLVGSIGLILAVPITSWVAVCFAPAPGSAEAARLAADPPLSHGHAHGPSRPGGRRGASPTDGAPNRWGRLER